MELNFHSPVINDKKKIDDILVDNHQFASDYTFGTSYLWAETYDIKICVYDNIIFKRYGKDNISYAFPQCNGDKYKALCYLEDYSYSVGSKMNFLGITEESATELENIMPGKFRFEEKKDIWDYIYKVSDLIELKGRKYHSKRNHISKFNKSYNWTYDIILPDDISQCRQIINSWFNNKGPEIGKDYVALQKALDNYDKLNLLGGILKISDKPVAFAIGEPINNDVFLVHFEKAIEGFDGLYSVINNEFCKTINTYKYVNREEDLGIAGLRKAKLSYKPIMMVKKYNAWEV